MDGPISFSIIIPTYCRPRQLGACLESVARLEYPRDRFEVVVVDDGSPTPAENVVLTFRDKFNVTLLTEKHGGPAAARNARAARAQGKFLAFTDDDCTPSPGWLEALAKRFGYQLRLRQMRGLCVTEDCSDFVPTLGQEWSQTVVE